MTSRRRRVLRVSFVIGLVVAFFALASYQVWSPTPPAGAPRIGVSMSTGLVRFVRRPTYEAALARAGGQAVPITPPRDSPVSESAIAALLEEVDALLLGGGADIDPAHYGGDPDNAAGTDRRRDDFEIHLIRGALERDMPILGICRGIQILNVAHGGTVRNLRADEALSERHGIDLVDSWAAHDVEVMAGTRLAGLVGAGGHQVNSWHGQAVEVVGEGLRVCATAGDGVIEGIERPDRAFVIGIQWHPELTLIDEAAQTLLGALVQQAEAYRAARSP
jgi:putative glutamine amidotransferase